VGDEDEVRARLLAERAAVLERMAATASDLTAVTEAARDSNLDDEHDPEGATIAWERQLTAAVGSRSTRRLAEIDAALQRLDAGTYGVCEACGRAIDPARLDALPAARRCVSCAA